MFGEQSFDAPVIYVVSESPRLEMLQARLKQAGLRPVPVRGSYLPPDSSPVLIDLATRDFSIVGDSSRLVVTVGRVGHTPDRSELHLSDVSEISALPSRLSIRQREHLRAREIELREQTFAQFKTASDIPGQSARTRLLWLGHDAPFLNAIKSSLSSKSISFVAAISQLNAEDFLASGTFDVVVLCPSVWNDGAASLLANLKQVQVETKPAVILLVRPEMSNLLNVLDTEQADHVLELRDDIEIVARDIAGICTNVRGSARTTFGLSAAAQDPKTGLATQSFLISHIEAQMAQADRLGTPLTLLAIETDTEARLETLAGALRPLLRESDLAARLDVNHICISLPNTPYRGGVILARRIEEAMSESINWRAIERRQFHTLKSLIGGLTARSGLVARNRA